MAVDTQKLFYLLDPVFQIENLAGKPVVGGHIEVFVAGTDTKYITWQDWGGARNPFKIPLKSDGRAVILVEPQYTYDVYVYDSFNNMVCSRLNVSPAIGGDVSVSGLTQVFHDETISGNGTPQEPIGVVSAGKVYEGIEPIVVNNDLDKISANHVPLGVQDPLYFVQDDEEGCIIGCSAQTEIPSAISGKWDAASDAVITNSAQWAENTEYEAGNYISIDNNVINVTGLSPVPTDTASTGLVAEVSADITAMIPDTSDMATQTWVNEQGYLTAHQSLDGLMSASLLEYSGSIITAYSGHKFAGEISGDAGDAEVNALVHSNSATWDNVTAKLDTTAFSDVSSTFLTAVPEGYATESWVTGQGYLTAETDWTNTITAASANAYNEATAAIPAPFDPTYLSGQIDTKLDSAIYAADSGTFLTAHQDISNLMPKSESANFYPMTGNPSGFITGVDLSPYQEKADMTAYATVESLTAKQDAGNYLSATDSANFLLTSDSGNFYPMTGNPSGFINELPAEEEVEFEEIDLAAYQPVSSMTAYANSAAVTGTAQYGLTTAGWSEITGGSVPEGVMVESGLEFNAVNEISGYNGSAIAQYGAEKQWLQHDDTLVHAANSAQYALGVNLSAVAQLLGVDETVLWSGTLTAINSTATLSEPVSSFEKIGVWTEVDGQTQEHTISAKDGYATIGYQWTWYPTLNNYNFRNCFLCLKLSGDKVITDKAITQTIAQNGGITVLLNEEWTYRPMRKIIGIGRKEV